MRQSTRHISIIAIIAIIGFLGILLGNIPDVYPSLVQHIPYLKKIETGFIALNNFKLKDINGRMVHIATLSPKEEGYEQILNILISFDPAVRNFVTFNAGKGEIQIVGNQSRRISFGDLHPFEAIWIGINGKGQNVCWMHDLKSMIKAQKIRYFSKTGFALAFLALLLDTIYSLYVVFTKEKQCVEIEQCLSDAEKLNQITEL